MLFVADWLVMYVLDSGGEGVTPLLSLLPTLVLSTFTLDRCGHGMILLLSIPSKVTIVLIRTMNWVVGILTVVVTLPVAVAVVTVVIILLLLVLILFTRQPKLMRDGEFCSGLLSG